MKGLTPPLSPQHRSPETVMRLDRMGAAHPHRLSFMRILLRHLASKNWQFTRPIWDVNPEGVGTATYQLSGPSHSYTLVAFAHNIPDEARSDRVIAEVWDATFALFDGTPSKQDIERLRQNVPKQEAGRISDKELVLSRANKSVRLFNTVVNSLAQGLQPDMAKIKRTGYLMRTSAVYGSGKFGAQDHSQYADRPELAAPFQAELMSVWLIREFTLDLVEHLAKSQNPEKAVSIEPNIRRTIGVGNSTGLGMAPFLMNHPRLLHHWIWARETALAKVLSQTDATPEQISHFEKVLQGAQNTASQWDCTHERQAPRIQQLRQDLAHAREYLHHFDWQQTMPWQALYQWAETNLDLECQECLAMLMLEPFADLVDDLSQWLSTDENTLPRISAEAKAKQILTNIKKQYAWAMALDLNTNQSHARFWYTSEEKLEPRLGERFDELGAELEHPFAIAQHIQALTQALETWSERDDGSIADFLQHHPEYRHTMRRVTGYKDYPYMEVQDNLIAHDMFPTDILRLKLSFFGANKFDPRSDRWLRITMFQHAPMPTEIHSRAVDDWVYPIGELA